MRGTVTIIDKGDVRVHSYMAPDDNINVTTQLIETPGRLVADYAMTRRESADALRAVLASGTVTASTAREQLSAAVRTILAAGTATGTLRDDVHAEDIVITLVGMLTTTSPADGRDQLGRMFDLLMDAVRRPNAGGTPA